MYLASFSLSVGWRRHLSRRARLSIVSAIWKFGRDTTISAEFFMTEISPLSITAELIKAFLFSRCSSARCAAALVADVMNGQLVIFNLGAKLTFNVVDQLGQANVVDLTATVTQEVVVRFDDLVEAIGNAVNVQALDQACVIHCIEVVVDGCHCNARHLQFGKKEDLVGGQMSVGLLENVDDQFALLRHDIPLVK